MKKIVLAGGTGSLGALLIKAFAEKGWETIVLTRNKAKKSTSLVKYMYWDGKTLGQWAESLVGSFGVINLSGKSIQCRFTAENKKELYSSRIEPTKVLGEAISNMSVKPSIWVNFSGISLFNGLQTLQDENSNQVGKGFLADLAQDWEAACLGNKIEGVHQVILRISPVFLPDSGFFAELLPLVKMGLGGQVGNGKQWMNWIHYQDLVNLIFWILERKAPSSVYHACTPHPTTNADFMKQFRDVVGISIGLPLPTLMAKFGAFAKGVDSSLLLDSVPVTTTRTVEEGFVFLYPDAKTSIKQLVK